MSHLTIHKTNQSIIRNKEQLEYGYLESLTFQIYLQLKIPIVDQFIVNTITIAKLMVI